MSLNRTRLKRGESQAKTGIAVKMSASWMGSLGQLFRSGANKQIEFTSLRADDDRSRIVEELIRDEIGYLVCNPALINSLFNAAELTFLKAAKTWMWIPFGANIDPHLSGAFADVGIPIRANYSSEEVGMIGAECPKCPGYYHVATSNVIVEVVDRSYDLQGATVGKVLVTHLHSYATPFIRYDLGDLACLSERCPCGHDGPTIYNLQGRINSVIKHRDGRLSPFMVHGRGLAALVDFAEFRIRQTAFEKIVVEIGGRSELGCDQIARIDAFVRSCVGSEFSIEIKTCREIDWGESQKRPGFTCEI